MEFKTSARIAAAGGISATAFAIGWFAPHGPAKVTYSQSTPETATALMPDQPLHIGDIDLGSLPDSLPQKIEAQAGNAVQVSLGYAAMTHTLSSAVRISRNEYLTAGHAVYDVNDKIMPDAKECGLLTVNSPSYLHHLKKPIGKIGYGITIPVQKAIGSAPNSNDTNNIPDIALLRVNRGQAQASINRHDTLPKLKKTVFSKAHEGQDVYLINYEALNGTKGEEFRSPVQVKRTLWSKPAIYGAIILYRETNGDYVALDGIKSYGAIPQSTTYGAASGGGVYTANGKLVGESVRASTESYTISELQGSGIQLSNYSKVRNLLLSFTIIQPIDKAIVDKLQAELTHAPSCHN